MGRIIQPKLIGKTERRSSRRFRAELASGWTCSLETGSAPYFPRGPGCVWELLSIPAPVSAGVRAVAAKDYKSIWS